MWKASVIKRYIKDHIMFTGKNEFREKVGFSIEDDILKYEKINIDLDMVTFKGHSNDTDITVEVLMDDDFNVNDKHTIDSLLEQEFIKIYFDDECVLWVE